MMFVSYSVSRVASIISGVPTCLSDCAVYSCGCAPRKRRGIGGAEEARTPDPLLAKEVLSQLSYGPWWPIDASLVGGLVGHSGLEPETSVLSGLRSNQLS